MKIITVLLGLTQLMAITTATASTFQSDELIALEAALKVRDQFVVALQNRDFGQITHDSMEGAIGILSDELRTQYNDEKNAKKILKIWKEHVESLSAASFHDLGDHAPLVPKIEEFLESLADKYGTIILTLPIIQDLRTLNYAIPVVFHPKGDWQNPQADNRIEYRKHFIPFANIVTYYGALVACNYFAQKSDQPDMKKVCKPAAEKLKFAMGRYIAAPISDWIFEQSNRTYVVTSKDRVYNSPEELRTAIRYELGEI